MTKPYAEILDDAVRTFPNGRTLAKSVSESADLQMLAVRNANKKADAFRVAADAFFYGEV